MIKDNIIKFGYGDIAVFSCGMGYIEFTNIKPPLECGTTITRDMNIEYGLNIKIYEDENWEIYNLIKTINENNRIVEYKGYILDFTNYNQKSVDVILKHAYNTVSIFALAC